MSSYFYSEVDKAVQQELNTRSGYIGGSPKSGGGAWRSKEAHAFTIGKGVFGYIKSYYYEGGEKKFITLGFDKGPQDGFDTLYRAGTRYTPRPVLTSINVGSTGTYGSLRKIDIKFTVFDPSDLDLYTDAFLLPRKDVTVGWGYTNYNDFKGKKNQNSVSITGNVFNFGYAVTENGAYECYFSLYTKGFFTLGTKLNQSSLSTAALPDDEPGNNLIINGLTSRLESDVVNFQNNIGTAYVKTITGHNDTKFYYAFAKNQARLSRTASGFPLHFNASNADQIMFAFQSFDNKDPQPGDTEGTNPPEEKSPFVYYVNLRYIVDILINTCIIDVLNNNTKRKEVLSHFRCNSQVSDTHYDSAVFSADPDTMIIPDHEMMTFKDDTSEDGTNIVSYFPKGLSRQGNKVSFKGAYGTNENKGDMSKILIEVETVKEMIDSMDEGALVTDFLNKIFRLINNLTGGIIQPILVDSSMESDITNTPYIDIVDNRAIYNKDITPYNFKSFANNSLIRDINLNTELSTAIATEFYLSANSKRTNKATAMSQVILGDYRTKIGAVSADDSVEGTTSPTSFLDAVNKIGDILDELNQIFVARAAYVTKGVTPEVVSSGKAALQSYGFNEDDSYKKPWNQGVLIPIKLSFTIDGINGLKFGNIVSTDWLPPRYKDLSGDPKIVFCITNINHEITNGGWTTNIETQCRANLKKAKGDIFN